MNAILKFCSCWGGPTEVTPLENQASAAPEQQSNTDAIKRIGYHLTGQFEDRSFYDITLYPNQNDRTVELKNFPEGWDLQRVAQDFCLRNLVVKKMGNHIVVVRGERNDYFPVDVDLRIVAIANRNLYRIDLRLFEVQISRAAALNPQSKTYEKVELDIYNLRHLRSFDFVKQIPHLDKNLNIQIIQEPFCVRTYLNQIIPDTGATVEQKGLFQEKQLVSERPYYIPLDAKDPLTGIVKPLDTYLDEFLNSDRRVLMIKGDRESGKTLGVKMFASRLLESEEGFFPIFGSENVPQNRKILWIFDGIKGDLDQLGPNAKALFLYRTGEEAPGFQEPIIEPFTKAKIYEYMDKFCDKKWTKEQNRRIFHFLGDDFFGLLTNPLLLKITVEFPLYKEESGVIKFRLLQHFVNLRALRSSRKTGIEAVKFIKYQIQVANRMYQYNQPAINKDPFFEDLIVGLDADSHQPNSIFLKECLVESPKGWTFMNDALQIHFATLFPSRFPEEELRKEIAETEEKFIDY